MLLIMRDPSPCVDLQHCMPSSLPYMLLSLPACGQYHLEGGCKGTFSSQDCLLWAQPQAALW